MTSRLKVRALLVCRWPPFGWVIREQSWARRFSADSSRHHSIRAGHSWCPWTLSSSLRSHLYYHFGGKGFSMSLGNTHSSGLSNTKSWKSLGCLGASTAWRFLCLILGCVAWATPSDLGMHTRFVMSGRQTFTMQRHWSFRTLLSQYTLPHPWMDTGIFQTCCFMVLVIP